MKILNLGFGILLLAGLAFAADDLESAFQGLQAAEKSGDTAQIKTFAVETYAQSAQVHAEYALYVAALKAPPAVGLELVQTLEQVAPKSKYLDDPALLLLPASNAFSHGQLDKALIYAKKAIVECGKKPDSNVLGRASYIAGMVEAKKNQWVAADHDLRVALPSLKGNDATLGPALFTLGLANYHIGHEIGNRSQLLDAQKFSEQAATLKFPDAQQAYINAQSIKAELAKK
jgi:tetratricopeptide (TPR) repeat protein